MSLCKANDLAKLMAQPRYTWEPVAMVNTEFVILLSGNPVWRLRAELGIHEQRIRPTKQFIRIGEVVDADEDESAVRQKTKDLVRSRLPLIQLRENDLHVDEVDPAIRKKPLSALNHLQIKSLRVQFQNIDAIDPMLIAIFIDRVHLNLNSPLDLAP